MKTKVTKKDIKNYYNTIISLPYCELSKLQKYKNPDFYSSGIYGWCCDYYDFGNICICTGYSPIGQTVDYELIKDFDCKAEKILNCRGLNFKSKGKKIDKLLNTFILQFK